MPIHRKRKPPAVPALQARRAALRVNFAYRYLLYLPEGYAADRSRRWPVLFFFHGRGERGRTLSAVKRHGLPKLITRGESFPFIVISPQCGATDYWWNYTALDAFVVNVLGHFRVDLDRVYLTGLSMGGFATWALAQEAPERYAAIAPICGGGDARFAVRLRDVPVWAFHGAEDAIIPARRTAEMIKGIRAAGGSPRVTIYPGVGHDSWTTTYENPALYEWLLSHRRKSRTRR